MNDRQNDRSPIPDHAHPRLTQDIRDIRGRSLVISAQGAGEVRLDGPDLRRAHALEASRVVLFEDELFFAFCFGHAFSNSSWRDFLFDLSLGTDAPTSSSLLEPESVDPPLVSGIVPR